MKVKQLVFTISTIGIAMVYACNSGTQKEEKSEKEAAKHENVMQTKEDILKRGKYLVTIMSCNDCHSPKVFGPKGPELDTTRLLSGYPSGNPVVKLTKEEKEATKRWVLFSPDLTTAVGPWGQSFSGNLTSDETGIGNWSEEQFLIAIRKGKLKGLENGRTLLPPMPWQLISNATDDDLKAIYAYLKSTKPVKNVVPGPIAPTDL